MQRKWIFALLVLLAACSPAVPYEQMPGSDLYSGANGSRMTAAAALQEAQWQEQALTATAGAPIVHITETVAALAIQQQLWTVTAQSIQETQIAAATQTASYWTPTPNATSTAAFAALNAQSTMIANNVQRDNLELARQQVMNDFNAKVVAYSWVIVVLVLALALMWITRRTRYQAAKVDARGNVLPILDIAEGTFTDIDRSPNHRGSVSNAVLARILTWWIEQKLGIPPQLPAVTAERQDKVTESDQMIDLATRGLLPDTTTETRKRKDQAGQQAMKQLSPPTLGSRFMVLDGETSNLDVIDSQIIQVLDMDWKEAQKK